MEYIKYIGYKNEGKVLKIFWEESNGLKNLVFKDSVLINKYLTNYEVNEKIALTMFLALIVPCYTNIDKNILLKSSYRINKNLYDKFSQYHQFNNIKLDNNCSYDEASPNYIFGEIIPGCFYGGGKDSLLASAILGELFGPENVSLLRLSWSPDIGQIEKKTNLLTPMKSFMEDKGYNFHMLESNFHTIVKDVTIGKMAHLGLYASMMLPIMKYNKINFVAYGFDATEFYITKDKESLPYRRSRPEIVSILNKALSIGMGYSIKLFNFNYAIPPTTAFKVLVNRYPEYMPNIYMYERSIGKWCIKCRKCLTYALYSLCYNLEETDFSLPYFFHNSIYVKNLVNKIKANNGLYNKESYELISYKKHICSTLDMISEIDLEYAKKRIYHPKYSDAYNNFLTIIQPLVGQKNSDFTSFWLQAQKEQEKYIGVGFDDKIVSIMKESGISICKKKVIEGKINKYEKLVDVVYKYNVEEE